ncbi:MAG TPA: sensor histidine kinase [Cyclobacteriaceae bacterium]
MSGALGSYREVVFQVVLHILVFIFYSFNREDPQIHFYQVVFFINYMVATLFISYFLLPKFFYAKRYLLFLTLTLSAFFGVIVIEELVLEQIYFPNTRRSSSFYVLYTLLDIFPVMAILAGFKFAWDALHKQREVEALKSTIQESELQFLKSQINPHFLFNNLNNLYSYAVENSPKTPTIILELSAVLRYMLYECKEKYVLLTKEVEQLKNFTQLYQLQIEERGKVNFKSDIKNPNCRIAPLILIIFIENAFKHSQAGQAENIYIDVDVNLSGDGHLSFYCENNYKPISRPEDQKGIGLENVKKRLQLLYPDAHKLEITESENQFKVHLSMDLNGDK